MRWSSAASTPSFIRRRRVGWPTSKQANGLDESRSWFVNYSEFGIIDVIPSRGLSRAPVLGEVVCCCSTGGAREQLGIIPRRFDALFVRSARFGEGGNRNDVAEACARV